MNSHWYHLLKGKYDISEKTVSIDFAKLMGSPLEAELTLFHESTHGILATQTDFGQGTHLYYRLCDFFTHVDREAAENMESQLYFAQRFTQEGLATLMQYLHAKNVAGRASADAWMSALSQRNPEYYSFLQELLFVREFSKTYREYFTQKVSYLAMETGIRRYAQEMDIFKSPQSLQHYLSDDDHIPDKRLEKIISTLRDKRWLVTKSMPEIAEVSGIKYFEPSTKEEAASYMTYLTSYTDKPHTFKPEDIGNSPQGNETLMEIYDNMLVANINMQFTASDLLKYEEFLHYSDKYEIVLAVLNTSDSVSLYVKGLYGLDPEVIMYGFLENGEKYICVIPKKLAETTMNIDLKEVTLAVKWGGYNPITDKNIWSDSLRSPDLVLYNTPIQLKTTLETVKQALPSIKFKHLHAAAMEDHPFQSLFVKVGNSHPIHAVNHFGNKNILDALDVIRKDSAVMDDVFLLENKKTVNNLMALWMGLFWEVDWVETMIDKETPHFRKKV